jgi:hypothetical protein
MRKCRGRATKRCQGGEREGAGVTHSAVIEREKMGEKKEKERREKNRGMEGGRSWCVACKKSVARMFCLGRSAFSNGGRKSRDAKGRMLLDWDGEPVQIKTIVAIELRITNF